MNTFYFDEKQSAIIQDLATQRAAMLAPQLPKGLSEFIAVCQIVAELNKEAVPVRDANTAHLDINMLDPLDSAAMTKAGLNPEKELGAYDPRASDPRCVHGITFKMPCAQCEKNWTDERLREAGDVNSLIPGKETALGDLALAEARKLSGANRAEPTEEEALPAYAGNRLDPDAI
jgi:hypothetical protein